MSETLSQIRRRAWATRRQKYGATGHNGSYSRPHGSCPDCARMRDWLVRLHVEGVLSEGQATKATGLDRVSVRIHADAAIREGESQ